MKSKQGVAFTFALFPSLKSDSCRPRRRTSAGPSAIASRTPREASLEADAEAMAHNGERHEGFGFLCVDLCTRLMAKMINSFEV